MKKQRVLVVGQTPPPYHGQAMMTQRLLDADYQKLKLYHVRMAFSKSAASLGTFEMRKLLHMIAIVGQVISARLRHQVTTLYYMPAGPNLTPVLRDIFILGLTRPWFRRTIFHFRAAGLSDFTKNQSGLVKRLARYVYRNPSVAIHLSGRNPDDGGYFGARQKVVVPNGLEDAALPYLPICRPATSPVRILFVGILCKSKGVRTLLEAITLLHQAGIAVRADFVGEFNSTSFQEEIEAYCGAEQIRDIVHFAGVQSGDQKWEYFRRADIFCFPSHYESESFGNVAVEAMMFALPVVATRWRGIPDIVQDEETGLLVPIQNPEATAEALQKLIDNPEQRRKMGTMGRARYEACYRLPIFVRRMEDVLTASG